MSEERYDRSLGSTIVCGLLGVMFVGLKLTGHIAWSWWWVTAPFWGPIALVLAVVAVAVPVLLVRNR